MTTELMQRAQVKDVYVHGINVRYAVAGEGPAVLAGAWPGLFHDYLVLQHGRSGDAGFTAIAVDMPGYGDSGLADHLGYEPETAARFLADFTAELGIERFSVVGNSAGGLIAGVTALEYPERVEKVALVAAAGLGRRLSWPLRIISVPVLGELIYKPRMISKAAIVKRIFFRPPAILGRHLAGNAASALPSPRPSGYAQVGAFRREPAGTAPETQHPASPSRPACTALGRLGRGRPGNPACEGGRCPARPAPQHGPRTPGVRPLAPHGKAGRVQPDTHGLPVPAITARRSFSRGRPGLDGIAQPIDNTPGAAGEDGCPAEGAATASEVVTPAPAYGARIMAFNSAIEWLTSTWRGRFLLLLVVAGISAIAFFMQGRIEVGRLSYGAVAGAVLLASGGLVVPVPALAITCTTATFLNPAAVAIIAGLAGTIGELTGYFLGYSGSSVLKRRRLYHRVENWMRRRGWLLLFVISAVPTPFST